jgi:hypothetical protein
MKVGDVVQWQWICLSGIGPGLDPQNCKKRKGKWDEEERKGERRRKRKEGSKEGGAHNQGSE